MDHTEVKAGNARNVILSYKEKIYFVNGINVKIQEEAGKINAVFHAKRASDNSVHDLDIEINQATYDILMEYARLDKLDLVMVLQINGIQSKWCLMSEDWLKSPLTKMSKTSYVV